MLEIVETKIPVEHRALVGRFFIVFSRFEYALKKAGRITPSCDPAWNDFADDNDANFVPESSPNLQEACQYFTDLPPMKQIYENGQLGWELTQVQNVCYLNRLLLSVRRVRNNMFHGGKFPFDGARNILLLEHALTILEACATLEPAVEFHLLND